MSAMAMDAAATMRLSIAGSIFSAFLLPNATPIPWAIRTGMSSRNISVFSAPLQRYPPAAGPGRCADRPGRHAQQEEKDRLRSGHGHLSLRPVRFPVLPEKDGDA